MPAERKYSNSDAGVSAPAGKLLAVTPSDSSELAEVTRGLYSGSGGTIVTVDENSNEAVFINVPSGVILPIRIKQVRVTSLTGGSPTLTTTALGLIALS